MNFNRSNKNQYLLKICIFLLLCPVTPVIDKRQNILKFTLLDSRIIKRLIIIFKKKRSDRYL